MRPAIFVLPLVVDACGSPPGRGLAYEVSVEAFAPTWQVQAAQHADDVWSAAVPGLTFSWRVQACDGSRGSGAICIHAVPHEAVQAISGADYLVGGVTAESGDGGNVTIDESLPADLFARVLAHELGHCMAGHAHLPAGNLMALYVDSPVPTDADVAHFWAARER